MRKKKFTRRATWLFTDLRKQPCPPGHFKTEDDLYQAYVDWLDYHDPIGFVRNWGLRREYEPQGKDLAAHVKDCETVQALTSSRTFCVADFASLPKTVGRFGAGSNST